MTWVFVLPFVRSGLSYHALFNICALVVLAPLTTLDNWRCEAEKFVPSLPVLVYSGDKETREEIRRKIVEKILSQPKNRQKDPDLDFDILITSYELAMNDAEFLRKFRWRYLIVDEAHRLKNSNSKLYLTLTTREGGYRLPPQRLLLTGTPLQNDLPELWSLLHFANPPIFSDREAFCSWFASVDWTKAMRTSARKSLTLKRTGSGDTDLALIDRLHDMIRPFLLRRLKEDVLAGKLPEKREVIFYTTLTPMQKEFYRWVLSKDIAKLHAATKSKASLMNCALYFGTFVHNFSHAPHTTLRYSDHAASQMLQPPVLI